MKKQLLILASILAVVFFSVQLAAAAKIDTSITSEEAYHPNTGGKYSVGTTIFSPAAILYVNDANSFFLHSNNLDKRPTSYPSKSLAALPAVPIFNLPGNNKKIAFLSITKEKVVFGAPSHKRFNYPAIALRIKF